MQRFKFLATGRLVHWILLVTVLSIQNICIFWFHYFQNVTFPWDFPESYYPWVAFWTAAIEKGIFPAWVPFQSMGYPLAIQLQAVLYYPPFWLFPLFHLAYTIQAAVAVQCLHVLAGGIGMYVFLKLFLRDSRYALLGAFIFQFFGGFYGNAQHSDIIRSFALTPWLLYVFSLVNHVPEQSSQSPRRFWDGLRNLALPKRIFFIPAVIFFAATGGYPGNFFAAVFILAIYTLVQLVEDYKENRSLVKAGSTGAVILMLTLLGLTMSAIHLAPSYAFRDQFSRFFQFSSLTKESLWIEQLPGMFLSSKTLPGEKSMNSAYITLPAVIFLSFVSFSSLKKYWAILAVGLFSLLMAAGDHSILYTGVTGLFYPLALSRFPTSDYRPFLAVVMIVFSMLGLRDLLEHRQSRFSLFFRILFCGAWFAGGIYLAYWRTPYIARVGMDDIAYTALRWTHLTPKATHVISAFLLFTATLGLLFILWKVQKSLTKVGLLLLLIVISVDGARVIDDMMTWREYIVFDRFQKNNLPLFVDGEFVPRRIFDHLPSTRPARKTVKDLHDFSWRGYLDGSYMMSDYKECPINACKVIEANPVYLQYMQKEWTPIILPDDSPEDSNRPAEIPETLIKSATEGRLTSGDGPASFDRSGITQVFYGVNSIAYRVDTARPIFLIENETYFPGWSARLLKDNRLITISAVEVNGAFRGWRLPAGQYQMTEEFNFPQYGLYASISLAAFMLWTGLVALAYRMNRQNRARAEQLARQPYLPN